ncbi:hypothetical protein ABZ845_17785 [Streptomyces sp. NPDC047022]|uniref:hypothetical protein n=1 Tax=Streptomyces sp. NPDC047022 TaxID=3155737 RepID=UPI0033EC3801
MTKNVKIAVALVGGYLLGRTKKAKMAMGLGLFLAGKKLDLDPRRVGKLIANSPALDGLNQQVRTELVEATRSAATEALTQRAAGLATSLARRTEALDAPGADGGAVRDDEPDARDERDEDAPGDERDDRTARRKTSGSSGGKASGDGGRTPAKRARSAAEGGARRTGAATRGRTGSAKSGTEKTGGTRSGAAKKRTTAARKSGGDDHA